MRLQNTKGEIWHHFIYQNAKFSVDWDQVKRYIALKLTNYLYMDLKFLELYKLANNNKILNNNISKT